MKVLLVSHWFPPVLSGSSFYTENTADALQEKGHLVRIVTFNWGDPVDTSKASKYPIDRLNVLKLPKLPLFFNLKRMGLTWFPSNIRRFEEILAEFRPDVIHHVNHIFDSSFLATQAAKKKGIPIVGSITTPVQHQNPFFHQLFEWADRLILGCLGVKRWDKVISLDKTVHDYVGRVYGAECQRRSTVIPFGVRYDLIEKYEQNGVERSGQPTILMVGHIHPFRNPVQLIRAMPLVLRKIPNVRVIFAGRVDLQEPVVVKQRLGLTDEQVIFLGETPHDEIVRLMKTAHIFASWVTGPYHSLGTAPMEAMLCATPVMNDLPEDLFGAGRLRKDENIMLVDSLDPQSIANGLIRVFTDEKYRQKVALAGREFVKTDLRWSAIADEFQSLYNQVVVKNGDACVSVQPSVV